MIRVGAPRKGHLELQRIARGVNKVRAEKGGVPTTVLRVRAPTVLIDLVSREVAQVEARLVVGRERVGQRGARRPGKDTKRVQVKVAVRVPSGPAARQRRF